MTNQEMIANAIANARAKLAERSKPPEITYGEQKVNEANLAKQGRIFDWNIDQQEAIDRARSGESFCLIGAAGTGKTTVLRGILQSVLRDNRLPIIERSTKWLKQGTPGVVLFSYTRRAVRNIAKQMPEELKAHCITGHKLLEYQPEKFEIEDGKGGTRISMRFIPTRTRFNTLPRNLRLVIVDESSMVASDFMDLVMNALPGRGADVQFIFLGDLHQLPPIYGNPILAAKLLQLPIVELKQVYRQALESPIITLAHQIKDGKMDEQFKCVTANLVVKSKVEGRGSVTIIPWKYKLDEEDGMFAMQRFLREWVRTDNRPNDGINNDKLNFEDDVILCAWNKRFGNIELNKAIGTELAIKYDRDVYEIFAGFAKIYLAVGDRVLHDKRDAVVTRVVRNSRYVGKLPQPHSKTMDYWGYTKTPTILHQTEEEIEALLDGMALVADIEDRVNEASHAVYIRYADQKEDEQEEILTSAGEVNSLELAYCMSVHKSQGSEWRRVIVITHACHIKMLSRELVYTAVTRASQELMIFMEPMLLTKASQRPRIKGNTLAEKLKWLEKKLLEQATLAKMRKAAKEAEEEENGE